MNWTVLATLILVLTVPPSALAVAGDDAAETVWADLDELARFELWSETERVIGLAHEKLVETAGRRFGPGR